MKLSEIVFVKLNAPANRSYEILIGPNLLSRIPTALSDVVSSNHVVVITDDVVGGLYLDSVIGQLDELVRRTESIVIPAGEDTKSIAQCEKIWDALLRLGTDRKSSIIALGGGVIGDLAGFIAASFARGLDYIQIPTTLLAQADSSVGGKVGINLPQAKNIIGAFWQPRRVLIDPNVLVTLDDRNYHAGLAEVIKYGMIMDRPLFEFIESRINEIRRRDPRTLTEIIAWCCRCKASIVEQDERELTGRRAILNYGHTLGHAIEVVFGYGTYLHGEAVSIGMTFAARLAGDIGMLDKREFQRQSELLSAFDLPIHLSDDRAGELLAVMHHDKKVSDGTLMLILPTEIGRAISVAAPDDDILEKVLNKIQYDEEP